MSENRMYESVPAFVRDERISELTAENARLRADIEHWRAENSQLRERVNSMCVDLDRLTVDAAAECGRLRAEREAFERQLSSVRFLLSNCTCICKWVHEAKATLAKLEVK